MFLTSVEAMWIHESPAVRTEVRQKANIEGICLSCATRVEGGGDRARFKVCRTVKDGVRARRATSARRGTTIRKW